MTQTNKRRELSTFDITMYHTMHNLKHLSECIDKQVVCILTKNEKVLSIGINQIVECNRNCHDKKNRICVVDHAEVVAGRNMEKRFATTLEGYGTSGIVAYVNLFPCVNCQLYLETMVGVREIITFGEAHKEWKSERIFLYDDLALELIEHNISMRNQMSIVQGELAELITALSDNYVRTDRSDHDIDRVLDEINDVELQLHILKLLIHAKNGKAEHEGEPNIYNELNRMRGIKYIHLLSRYAENGTIASVKSI